MMPGIISMPADTVLGVLSRLGTKKCPLLNKLSEVRRIYVIRYNGLDLPNLAG